MRRIESSSPGRERGGRSAACATTFRTPCWPPLARLIEIESIGDRRCDAERCKHVWCDHSELLHEIFLLSFYSEDLPLGSSLGTIEVVQHKWSATFPLAF